MTDAMVHLYDHHELPLVEPASTRTERSSPPPCHASRTLARSSESILDVKASQCRRARER